MALNGHTPRCRDCYTTIAAFGGFCESCSEKFDGHPCQRCSAGEYVSERSAHREGRKDAFSVYCDSCDHGPDPAAALKPINV